MTTKEVILNEIQKIPEVMLGEVLDFIRFLESKVMDRQSDISIASESSLLKDWLKPEEDAAWQDL